MKIVIIDYGMGNLHSIIGALRFINIEDIEISNELTTLKKADRFILPGVGSFAKAMQNIRAKNLDHYLQELVIGNKKPVLGICLGMQLLSQSSTEHGYNLGLGFIPGTVTRFDEHSHFKVPHVGFNQVEVNSNSKLYANMQDNMDFYFTHSFKLETESKINQCMCNYGNKFIASYEIDHIAGVQFHPELSQRNGLKLLQNFVNNF